MYHIRVTYYDIKYNIIQPCAYNWAWLVETNTILKTQHISSHLRWLNMKSPCFMFKFLYGGFMRFPESWGYTPSSRPFSIGIFHEINQSFWGSSINWTAPKLSRSYLHEVTQVRFLSKPLILCGCSMVHDAVHDAVIIFPSFFPQFFQWDPTRPQQPAEAVWHGTQELATAVDGFLQQQLWVLVIFCSHGPTKSEKKSSH